MSSQFILVIVGSGEHCNSHFVVEQNVTGLWSGKSCRYRFESSISGGCMLLTSSRGLLCSPNSVLFVCLTVPGLPSSVQHAESLVVACGV